VVKISMTLIQTISASSDVAGFQFSSLPQTFTDLYVVVSYRNVASATTANPVIRFNGATTNFSSRVLFGNGSNPSSATDTTSNALYGAGNGDTSTANTFGSFAAYITNYSGSTNKSVSIDSVGEQNGTTAVQMLTAGLWSNTAAITQLNVLDYGGVNLKTGSSASLYGILKGSGGATVS
jgi:hypothetical protein